MTCEQYTELLSQRMDGELTPVQAEELEAHLAECPLCRALAEELSAVTAALRDLDELEAPEGFADAVMTRVRAESPAAPKVIPFFRRPQVRALAGLAACAALCVGLYSAGMFPRRDVSSKSAMVEMASPAAAAPAEAPAAEAPMMAASAPAAAPRAEEDVCAEAEMEMLVKGINGQSADAAPQETAAGDSLEEYTHVTEASAPGHYGIYGEQVFRVTWGETPAAPSARILGSAESLNDFLAQFPVDDLSGIADAYPAEFFESAQLLAVVVEESSGSVRHTLAFQGLLKDSVTVLRHLPEEGTDDMAAWLILAETDAGFEDGKEFAVLLETE